jgi:hypothetical protein
VTAGVAGFGTAGTVTGVVDLTNDSAIEFLKGQIDTIGASWQLSLDGNNAFIEDGATNSNSALTSLANVAGSFYLDELRLKFSKPIEIKFAKVKVTRPGKKVIKTGAAKLDPADNTVLIVPRASPLPDHRRLAGARSCRRPHDYGQLRFRFDEVAARGGG